MNQNTLFITTPIGPLTLSATPSGLSELSFGKIKKASTQTKNPHLLKAQKELALYFKGKLKKFSIKLDFQMGTEFQKNAWNTLTKIPFGYTISYSEQATKMGNTKARRAVGAANGKNPIPIIVPCHRVIASNQKLHGYSSGLHIKEALLKIEGHTIKNKSCLKKVK